nr:MAG TPA: hypothetical protein [Caudoviricetes sp.]
MPWELVAQSWRGAPVFPKRKFPAFSLDSAPRALTTSSLYQRRWAHVGGASLLRRSDGWLQRLQTRTGRIRVSSCLSWVMTTTSPKTLSLCSRPGALIQTALKSAKRRPWTPWAKNLKIYKTVRRCQCLGLTSVDAGFIQGR